jgi:cytochrome bd-type quinol oxidase subunit 1
MGAFLTSFLFALGVSAWVYDKSQKHNGGLAQQSAIAAGIVGVIALIIFFTIFTMLVNRLPQ